jgi:hypothetical protein
MRACEVVTNQYLSAVHWEKQKIRKFPESRNVSQFFSLQQPEMPKNHGYNLKHDSLEVMTNLYLSGIWRKMQETYKNSKMHECFSIFSGCRSLDCENIMVTTSSMMQLQDSE